MFNPVAVVATSTLLTPGKGGLILLEAQLRARPLSSLPTMKDGSNSVGPVTGVEGLLYAGCFAPIVEDAFDSLTTDDALTVNVSAVDCTTLKSLGAAVK